MLFLSNTKIVLPLFFTIYSICLTTDATILPKPLAAIEDKSVKTDIKTEISGSVLYTDVQAAEIGNGELAENDKETPELGDPNIPIFNKDEVADTFALITASVIPMVDNVKISGIGTRYLIEIDGKWIEGRTRPEKIKNEQVSIKKVDGRVFIQFKITPLQPNTKYHFFFTASYGEKQYSGNPEFIEINTKLAAPKISIVKRKWVLLFEDKEVKSYHVQINKVKKNDKEGDCVFEVKLSSCFGKELIIPELTSGEKYTIKTWYIDVNDNESNPAIDEYTA